MVTVLRESARYFAVRMELGSEMTQVLILLTVVVAAMLTYLLSLSGTLKTGFENLNNTIESYL